MNYYGSKELAASLRTVRRNTLVIAEEIPEEHYGFHATTGTRTVAETLVHMTLAPRLQEQIHKVEQRTTLEGFDFIGFIRPLMSEETAPHSKAQILDMLREQGERFSSWIEGLTDEFLGQRVAMPPGMTVASKTRFEMILGVKEHEMHHRGQLMLIERMIGVVPHLTREMQSRIAAMEQARSGSAKA